MSDRCDLTELLVDQCAHCLGHKDVETIDPGSVAVLRTMAARYDGRCALDARHAVAAGDRIGYTDHGWVCAPCTQAGQAP